MQNNYVYKCSALELIMVIIRNNFSLTVHVTASFSDGFDSWRSSSSWFFCTLHCLAADAASADCLIFFTLIVYPYINIRNTY